MNRKILIAIFLVFLVGAGFTTLRDKDLDIVKNLDIYCTLFRELNMFYVDDTNPEELVTTSINSMLQSLDPYTTYISEKEMDDFNFQTTGEYGGIGSLIRSAGEYVVISDPYEGFPAARSGLMAGDILISVNGTSTRDLSISRVSDLLKGEPGTEVTLEIKRTGTEEVLSFTLTREKITLTNVPYYGMLNEHTGYIRLSNFTTNASQEVRQAYESLRENDGFNRLILDLRSNPGGLLIEAVRTCNLFVEKGELIVSTKGKVKQWDNEYKTSGEALDTEIPLVVMVNRASASASEIVAGAMQDLDRGVIVGQRTFGKGLVQTTRQLKYNAQLKVTTAKYYIPSGRCIQALDYTHRNEDGSVGTIPDSLISEYTTRNGRLVYDGGGVRPDIEIVPETLSEITLRLYTGNVIFDFATNYRADHPNIPSVSEFTLSDEEYADFKNYVEQQDFEFETASERGFNSLVETAKREKYYELAKEEFLALEQKLGHDNLKDLDTFRPEIQQILEEEIIGRYYYQKGRIRAQLKEDVQLDKALELLSHPLKISNILNGEEGALAKQ
jgi:carboxyl-terminal processing protease